MKRLFYVIVGILLFWPIKAQVSNSLEGKGEKSPAQVKKEIKRVKKEHEMAVKRAAKYGRKRHLAIQDPAVRKRIKRNLRRSNRQMRAK